MTHREPTVYTRALMVACPHCGSVPGAFCYDKRGSQLPTGRVHYRRTVECTRQFPAKTTGGVA
ncbi:zinc finger domain-containing protein [Streptomyces sp. NPDC001274]